MVITTLPGYCVAFLRPDAQRVSRWEGVRDADGNGGQRRSERWRQPLELHFARKLAGRHLLGKNNDGDLHPMLIQETKTFKSLCTAHKAKNSHFSTVYLQETFQLRMKCLAPLPEYLNLKVKLLGPGKFHSALPFLWCPIISLQFNSVENRSKN